MYTIPLTGVQGVGKTAISIELSKIYPSLAYKDYADFMLDASNICSKDTIEKLHSEERIPIYQKANELLLDFLDSNSAEAIILESHVSVELPDGSLISFSPDEFKLLRTELIIVIEASPDEICRRRAEDQARIRTVGKVDSVENQQKWNRNRVEIISKELKIPYYLVQNDSLSACVNRISRIFIENESLVLRKRTE
jgi:adenylate kinase